MVHIKKHKSNDAVSDNDNDAQNLKSND